MVATQIRGICFHPIFRAQPSPPGHISLALSLKFATLNGFVCFEWQCSVQLRTSPSSPAGSPENCLEVSFFLEVAWLPAGREGGCLWSDEHFLGWPIHGWWAAHLARGSHGREAPVCTCVFARWLITSHLLNRIFKPHLLFYFILFHYIFLLLT